CYPMRKQTIVPLRNRVRDDRSDPRLLAAGSFASTEAPSPRRGRRLDKGRTPQARHCAGESVSFARVREVVELSDAVSFCPDTDLARSGESVVFDIEQMLAVEVGFETIAGEFHAQGMPLARRNFLLDSVTTFATHDVKGSPLAIHSLVENDIVFVRVRAKDVVVIRILCAPDHAAGLVFSAADRVELHLDEPVFQRRVVFNADWKRCLTRLLEHIRLARCGIVFFHGPFCRAATGLRGGPAGRRRAGLHVVKVDRLSDGSSCRDCHRDYRYTHLFHRFLTWLIPFLTWAS